MRMLSAGDSEAVIIGNSVKIEFLKSQDLITNKSNTLVFSTRNSAGRATLELSQVQF